MKHNYSTDMHKRLIYLIIFSALIVCEVLIALFVHDEFIRPYVGDVIVIEVIYCFIRVLIPNRVKLLPLYVFMFATVIEIGQYFNYVSLLGLDENAFFRTLLGMSFSWADIICYAVGAVICFVVEYASRKKVEV